MCVREINSPTPERGLVEAEHGRGSVPAAAGERSGQQARDGGGKWHAGGGAQDVTRWVGNSDSRWWPFPRPYTHQLHVGTVVGHFWACIAAVLSSHHWGQCNVCAPASASSWRMEDLRGFISCVVSCCALWFPSASSRLGALVGWAPCWRGVWSPVTFHAWFPSGNGTVLKCSTLLTQLWQRSQLKAMAMAIPFAQPFQLDWAGGPLPLLMLLSP